VPAEEARPGVEETERIVLSPDASAVRQARHFVAARCRAAGLDADMCDTIVLLTSETVTNAVIHGRSEARLALTTSDSVVHIEVGDDNSRAPRLEDADADALDGRGLRILDMAASRWGVTPMPIGKVVWFELDRP